MKKQIISTLITIITLTVSANAQTANVWKGGFPGHENDWNCSKNWSLGKTPDVFDNVVIPDVSTTTRRYPVIASGEVEIMSLYVQNGATLTLTPSGRLQAENFNCEGTCKGCEWRVLDEGNTTAMTGSPR